MLAFAPRLSCLPVWLPDALPGTSTPTASSFSSRPPPDRALCRRCAAVGLIRSTTTPSAARGIASSLRTRRRTAALSPASSFVQSSSIEPSVPPPILLGSSSYAECAVRRHAAPAVLKEGPRRRGTAPQWNVHGMCMGCAWGMHRMCVGCVQGEHPSRQQRATTLRAAGLGALHPRCFGSCRAQVPLLMPPLDLSSCTRSRRGRLMDELA